MSQLIEDLQEIHNDLLDCDVDENELIAGRLAAIISALTPGVDIKQMVIAEQAAATFRDSFCPLVHSVFSGFKAAGFAPPQAYDLAKCWMMAQLQISRQQGEQ